MSPDNETHTSTPTTMSRRAVLAAAGGGILGLATIAATVGAPRVARATVTHERDRARVVVVGGGIAGAATAWLLDGEHDVVLLEAAPELGGHAHTIPVSVEGKNIAVDTGAQYFGPSSHPTYTKLVREVLNAPVVPALMDITVHEYGRKHPVLVTPHIERKSPLIKRRYATALAAMAVFSHKAKHLEEEGDWSMTVEEFIENLKVRSHLREQLLYPFCASIYGCSISEVKTMSARATFAFFVRSVQSNPLKQPEFYNARDGLQSVVKSLRDQFTTVTPRVRSAAVRMSREDGVYQVMDSHGRIHEADHVVLTLPGHAGVRLLERFSRAEHLTSVYRRFPYVDARLLIHSDPVYMPERRADWSAYNVTYDGDWGETCMWYGAFRDVELFKSWANNRREEPSEMIGTFDFKHALLTPDFMRAQADIETQQGHDGLWFAGSHITDVASQESAMSSALRVARSLAPRSANLARLTG